ncbi:hypothetical protein KDA11_04640 [Candidatus Saccharibacteria bacterium]|nr:hypothetical protein [Candidatus Saccharibacteria bacterium]
MHLSDIDFIVVAKRPWDESGIFTRQGEELPFQDDGPWEPKGCLMPYEFGRSCLIINVENVAPTFHCQSPVIKFLSGNEVFVPFLEFNVDYKFAFYCHQIANWYYVRASGMYLQGLLQENEELRAILSGLIGEHVGPPNIEPTYSDVATCNLGAAFKNFLGAACIRELNARLAERIVTSTGKF